MTQQSNNGGAAFPYGHMNIGDGDSVAYHNGMSLRDWFAGQAPVDWDMARQSSGLGLIVSAMDRKALWASMAILRYEYADAMLAARAQEASHDAD